MSKDPAVLFYTSDFISGTLTMTNEQRGKYILLLCLQHQKGYLTEKDMLNICNSYDEDIWSKFENREGKFFNLRMELEKEKRRKYSESRANNRTGKTKDKKDIKKTSKSYVIHMENENENENENKNKSKITRKKENFTPPTPDEVENYFGDNGYDPEIGQKAYSYYAASGWKDSTGKQVLNWKQKMIAVWFKPENVKKVEYQRKGLFINDEMP